ncbi:MAG: Fe-S cluster assembly protein HesB [Actinobacteria bacterium]|nr:Fe-S cluster assembly protein HesB [Actinomycetota bacterium]
MALLGGWEKAGPGGEPIDLWRTIVSHGVAGLPPMWIDEKLKTLDVTLLVSGGPARTVRVVDEDSIIEVWVCGRAPGRAARAELTRTVAHILRLDEDLSEFYALAGQDPELAWVTRGAGRLIRSATVFEEVVKTICTTNCAWSATVRMVTALVEHLGAAAPEARPTGARGRAFPTPRAMAEASEDFYREVVRAGYRGRYLLDLAVAETEGRIDLEELGTASPAEIDDDEIEQRLLLLPGVGPYSAAHIMMMLGRYSRLILDSWTRPTYLRIAGKRTAKDTTIARRFRRYGPYAGLAFWLYLTRDWVEESATGPARPGPPPVV